MSENTETSRPQATELVNTLVDFDQSRLDEYKHDPDSLQALLFDAEQRLTAKSKQAQDARSARDAYVALYPTTEVEVFGLKMTKEDPRLDTDHLARLEEDVHDAERSEALWLSIHKTTHEYLTAAHEVQRAQAEARAALHDEISTLPAGIPESQRVGRANEPDMRSRELADALANESDTGARDTLDIPVPRARPTTTPADVASMPPATGVWSTEQQHNRAQEIADTGADMREVSRGDTLGAIVRGITGKLDYGMPVDYRSEKISDNKPARLADANRIYPGQYVWLEDHGGKDTVVVSDVPRAVVDESAADARGEVAAEDESVISTQPMLEEGVVGGTAVVPAPSGEQVVAGSLQVNDGPSDGSITSESGITINNAPDAVSASPEVADVVVREVLHAVPQGGMQEVLSDFNPSVEMPVGQQVPHGVSAGQPQLSVVVEAQSLVADERIPTVVRDALRGIPVLEHGRQLTTERDGTVHPPDVSDPATVRSYESLAAAVSTARESNDGSTIRAVAQLAEMIRVFFQNADGAMHSQDYAVHLEQLQTADEYKDMLGEHTMTPPVVLYTEGGSQMRKSTLSEATRLDIVQVVPRDELDLPMTHADIQHSDADALYGRLRDGRWVSLGERGAHLRRTDETVVSDIQIN